MTPGDVTREHLVHDLLDITIIVQVYEESFLRKSKDNAKTILQPVRSWYAE